MIRLSAQRNQRSPSFRNKQALVKVNLGNHQLPQDFFPKIISQSPQKKDETQKGDDILAEWYQRDHSSQHEQKTLIRKSIYRQHPLKINLIKQDHKSRCKSKQRYTDDYYQQMKDNLTKNSKITIKSVFVQTRQGLLPREKSVKTPLVHNKILYIKSLDKEHKRNSTPKKQKPYEINRSHKQLSRGLNNQQEKQQRQEVSFGFDGMITFNKFR